MMKNIDMYINKIVEVHLFNGEILEGKMGYITEFSEKFSWRKPNYYFIGNYSFKKSHVKKIKKI